MKVKYFFLGYFLLIYANLFAQELSIDKFFISFGIAKIPLHIERTDKYRIMTYPALEFGFRINEKIYARGSYLYHDLKIYRGVERNMFVETPSLTSYEVATENIGKKFTLSQFSDYFFMGIKYEYINKKFFNLLVGCDIGLRFGETSVIASISENPNWPKGFEVHSDSQNSNSPGMRLNISPQIIFLNLVYLEPSFGTYIFFNWPVLQPFGTLQLGFAF